MTTAAHFLADYGRATATTRFMVDMASLPSGQPTRSLLATLLHTESNWETSWCRVLAWLLVPGEDLDAAHRLRAVLLTRLLGSTKFNDDHWDVSLERPTSDGGRLDITLESRHHSVLVVIEAKIDHDESLAQVRRYASYIRELRHQTTAGALLTLSDGDLSESDLAGCGFCRLRWSEVATWIADARDAADDPPLGHPWPTVAAEFVALIQSRGAP